LEGPGTGPEAAGPQPPEPPDLRPPGPPAPAARRRFGPLAAFLVFLAYLGAQLIAQVVVGAIAGVRAVLGNHPLKDVMAESMPAILLFSMSFGGAGALLVTRALAGPLRPSGRFGIRAATLRQTLAGAGAGLLLGLLLGETTVLVPPPTDADTMFTHLTSTGTGYWSLVLVALLLAPPIEEFVFRGVIFDGLRARMPTALAMLIVTVLFTALHAAELVHYPPGFGLIALLSLVTLVLRTRTGSLFPAMAVHVVYNLFAVFA